MADDIRSRAGLDPREEAARRIRDGEARRAAAREALTQEQMRERTMREMEERRAARAAAPAAAEGPARPANPRPNVASRVPSAGTVARVGSRAVPGMNVLRGVMPTSLEEGARFEEEGLRRARAEQMAQQRSAMEQELGEAPQRMPTPRPAPAARPRPAAAAAPRRREMTADELNALAMGERGMDADAEVARMRIEQRRRELEERGTAFKKGGMIKKKAGGMIAKPKAAPKKMMKGGAVAKPKVAVKSKGKPMPFKKGGVIKKGRK